MATELATAYISLIPTLKGAGKSIQSELDGVNVDPSAKKMGKRLGDGLTDGANAGANGVKSALGGIARVAGPILAAVGFSNLVSEAGAATDATQKFKSTLDFAGLGTPEIEALSKSTRKYADETVYALSDIQNITAQLAANSVPNYDKLAEAAGNLNAVAGGSAETFSRVGLVLTQTAGAGKLTTENWNQLTDAIPGASGKLQEAMLKNGAYTGNFREAMEKGEISAEEFNQAIMDLGFEDAAVEAAKSTSTFEGAFGNMQAAVVGGLSDIMTRLQPAITDAMNAVTPVIEGVLEGVGSAVQFIIDNFDRIAPVVAAAAGAFATFKAAMAISGAVSALSGPMAALSSSVKGVGIANTVAGGVKALGGAISTALGGPVGVAVAAIAGLVAAFVVAYNTNETFRAAIQTAWAQIQALAAAVWPVIQQTITLVMQAIQAVVAAVWPVIQNIFTVAGTAIQGVVNAVFPFIQALITNVMNVINAVIGTVLALIKGDWEGVWNGIKAIGQTVWDAIKNIVTAGINAAKGVISSVLNAIKGIWDGAWSALKSFVGDIWEGIKTGVSNGIDAVMNFIGELPGKITGFFADAGSWLFDAGKSILNGLKDGLMSAFEGVKDFVGGIGDWIVSHKGPPSYDKVMLVKNGQLIMGGLLDGMMRGWGDVESFIGSRNAEISASYTASGGRMAAASTTAGGNVYNLYLDGRALHVDDRIADAMERFVGVVVSSIN